MPIPVESYGKAIAAYARAAKGEQAAEPGNQSGAPSFADMVKGAIDDAVSSGKNAEKVSVAAVGDGAGLDTVVTAVAEAELTLQTVVAVRERVIEAYKEIMRMPI